MIRFLVWDVDGTLLDTYPAMTAAIAAAFGDLGVEVPETQVNRLCKVSFDHCMQILTQRYQVHADQVLECLDRRREDIVLTEQHPFPGVHEVCAQVLEMGGANFILTHRDRASLRVLLDAHHLASYFTDAVAGDDGFPRKPNPLGLTTLLSRHGIAKGEALMIGDRELDIAAGRRAGIATCLYARDQLESVAPEADFEIRAYSELLGWLRQQTSSAPVVSEPACSDRDGGRA